MSMGASTESVAQLDLPPPPPREARARNTLTAASVLALALQALSARLVLLVALLMTFGLFAWAMARPTVLDFSGAAGFACLVFLPVLWRSHAHSQNS
jgi:hypothetical protein